MSTKREEVCEICGRVPVRWDHDSIARRLPKLASEIIRALENHSVWPCSKCKTLVDELRALAPNQPNETEKQRG